MKSLLIGLLAGLAVLVTPLGWSYMVFGNLRDGLRVLGGHTVVLPQPIVFAGELQVGESASVKISVQNLTGESVRILDADTDCSCALVSGVPADIPARGTQHFVVEVSPQANDAGRLIERRIQIFTDIPPKSGELWAIVRASVADSASTMTETE